MAGPVGAAGKRKKGESFVFGGGGASRLHLQIDGHLPHHRPTGPSCKGPDQPPGGVCAHMGVGHGVRLRRGGTVLGRAALGSTEEGAREL